MNRRVFAQMIAKRLDTEHESLHTQWHQNGRIASAVLDDVLPPEIAQALFAAFPQPDTLTLRASLRERKWVGVQMDTYDPLIGDITFAFQDPRVVRAIADITELPDLLPDAHLYAGGISMMGPGHFLLPHLDNSHDKDRQLYRAINLLYYVTPDWQGDFGGNLELWDQGPKHPQRTIVSRGNRLVLMATHTHSWHSVSPVVHPGVRCCVSNYYFAPHPLDGDPSFHVTTFRGYPDQPVRDVLLVGDNFLRASIRRVVKKQTTFQVYENGNDTH